MTKKITLLCGGFLLIAGSASAQKWQPGYVVWPESDQLHNYVSQWNGGNGKITVNGKEWEDEEFFISRVKPKTRFVNRKSQVYSDFDVDNDKRHVWWVPIGNGSNGNPNAFQNGTMDSEAFSLWSYLDHYGNWTASYGWVPGGFADAAHKNGVAVSGVASVPFGGISANWRSCFQAMQNLSADAVGKFLYYHGVDGVGYNSEWSGYAPAPGLTTLHNGIEAYMATRNPLWEVIWYAGTTDAGSCMFDSGVGSGGGNSKLFEGASMFLNYNWNRPNTIQRSVEYAKSVGKSPFYIYAGMNQQGGEPRSGENYPMLKDYQYSIGVWGAHEYNMLWQGRNSKGSAVETMQRTYINDCEQWFGNGPRNPAIRKAITTNRSHRPSDNWAGISSMMSARSAINWAVKDEPFYTFFNIGNGKFFNWKGERVSDKEWYSLGIQDYMPTWRWWFAPTFMNGNISESDVNLSADITWDDAYVGGSCLQIAGTTDSEYLHLFKTQLQVMAKQVITVRYKLLEGSGDVNLVAANGNDPAKIATGCKWTVLTAANSSAALDASYEEGWQKAQFELTAPQYAQLNASKGHLGVLALEFKNVKDMKLLLGELSITAAAETATPAAPEIKLSKVLGNTYTGVDGKIIWSMANSKAAGEPVYNSDVNASMYKLYAQEEGGEPKFVGATTSWAGLIYQAPNTDDSKKIRFGVSAVSVDTKNESAISWGEYLSKGDYTSSNDVVLDKTVVKPGESFTIYYLDDKHSASAFELVDAAGNTIASGSGIELFVENGCPEVGGYDLYIDRGTDNERHYGYFVQVSGEEVGAYPEIYSISNNGTEVEEGAAKVDIDITDTPTLSYEGRKSDGSASRALALNSRMIGSRVGDLGLQSGQSFSIAGWFRFDEFPKDSWAFMNVSNLGGAWPQCNWGWSWNNVDEQGRIHCTFRGNASDSSSPGELHYEFPNTVLQAEIWTHIAFVCEYNEAGNAFRLSLYINGVKQESLFHQFARWNSGAMIHQNKTTEEWCTGQSYGISSADVIYFGGPEYQHSAVEGVVDDFQVWGKAMTADDVKASMAGLDPENLPASVIALWDFETAADENNNFAAKGSKAGAAAFSHQWDKIGETDLNASLITFEPQFASGCPFLTGTAFPIETKAEWSDTHHKTEFTKQAALRAGVTEGENGAVKVKFAKKGDHTVTLTLKNSYAAASRQFPVFAVKDNAAIGEIGADGDVNTYTVDDVLFLEFAADGDYMVDVYNTSGMLVASKHAQVTAGQNARITLGQPGIYLVKVVRDGQVLRTVKVLSK